jgi:hypothetical protein
MSRRLTSRSRLEEGETPPDLTKMVGFTWNAINDFDYWMEERTKAVAQLDTLDWASHNLGAIESNVKSMEEACHAVRTRCVLLKHLVQLRDKIRRLREEVDGLSEFEIAQRRREANQLESVNLKNVEDALKELT